MCLPLYSVSFIALFLSFELHFWITHQLPAIYFLPFYKMIFSYRECGDGVKCRGRRISTIISLRKWRRFLSQRLWLNWIWSSQLSDMRAENFSKRCDRFVGRSKNIVFVNFCISCIINCFSWSVSTMRNSADKRKCIARPLKQNVRKIMKCLLRREVSNSYFQHV